MALSFPMLAPKPRFFCKFPIRRRFFLLRSYTSLPPLPRPPQLSLLADKCSSMDQLKQVHAQMVVSARIHDNFAASRLLSFCALSELGDLSYALRIFRNLPEPNGFMWNTLIRAQASGSNPCEAIYLYVKMRRLGVVPGNHTFPFVLKACSNSRSLKSCKQVHTQVVKFGLDLDLHVVNGLLFLPYATSCLLGPLLVLLGPERAQGAFKGWKKNAAGKTLSSASIHGISNCRAPFSFTDLLQNPDFESPPSNLPKYSTDTVVLSSQNNTIPGWTFEWTVP
ncbi:hypothetical protein FEM48_Zijuj09G0219900 [Ziziphus jujuba var. spinosa]|uniref:Pentatricopeptide repeat-containing protein n=1 Tax=Ziziphus jujuba var. spinosa TaxID=714518 RepID=A0A978UVJ8_ZIZJJ|nr:hypothetical protein FEM48_Zijuj09G0219900 [Ziziphus jujuba var. spinosa]